MKATWLLALSFAHASYSTLVQSPLGRATELVVLRTANNCAVQSLRQVLPHKDLSHKGPTTIVEIEEEKGVTDGSELIYITAINDDAAWARAATECPLDRTGPDAQWSTTTFDRSLSLIAPPPLDVFPLFTSGDASNRRNLVFFSDGYTAEEREKFVADVNRLVHDLINNQTFASVKPLLNFWAAFSPSNESGIGVGGKPKDTVFGLYRDGTELRGVYTAKPKLVRSACISMGDKCNYPVLLGNSDLYGGLGGSYSITTASYLNGALVLRHELGHSIIKVGEEYDGGYAYFGPNSSLDSDGSSFKWAHWLDQGDPSHPERAIMSLQAYPWMMLNHTKPYRASFSSSGTYSRYLVKFSVSGIPFNSYLRVELDGVDAGFDPRPDVGLDRWHYDIAKDEPLHAGEHEVSFWLGEEADERVAQLCSVEILEFGNEDEFNMTPNAISAFPTFSLGNETTYRPTNEDCLMRKVTNTNFCGPCLEGLWLNLLSRVDLIDGLDVQITKSSPRFAGHFLLASLTLVPFGELRFPPVEGEEYEILWKRNGEVIRGATNSTVLSVSVTGNWDGEVPGVASEGGKETYSVEVILHTPEVRKDIKGRLGAARSFHLK